MGMSFAGPQGAPSGAGMEAAVAAGMGAGVGTPPGLSMTAGFGTLAAGPSTSAGFGTPGVLSPSAGLGTPAGHSTLLGSYTLIGATGIPGAGASQSHVHPPPAAERAQTYMVKRTDEHTCLICRL